MGEVSISGKGLGDQKTFGFGVSVLWWVGGRDNSNWTLWCLPLNWANSCSSRFELWIHLSQYACVGLHTRELRWKTVRFLYELSGVRCFSWKLVLFSYSFFLFSSLLPLLPPPPLHCPPLSPFLFFFLFVFLFYFFNRILFHLCRHTLGSSSCCLSSSRCGTWILKMTLEMR